MMAIPIRVLVVEDSAPDAELMLRALREEGYAPAAERVDTPQAMATALETQSWDVIIADYVMPEFSGLDALRLVQGKGLDIPLIIVSGNVGEDVAVNAVRAGARDYVLKGNLTRLAPAVKREIEEAELRRRMLEAKKHAEEALRQSHEELEQRVEKRTAELRETNARLNCEISERILAEAALKDSEGLFRSLAENANAIVGIVQDNRFAYVNPYFSRLTDYSRDELLAMDISQIIAPASQAMVLKRAQLRLAGDTSTPPHYEFAILTKDGRERWLDFSATRIEYHGQPAIAGIAYDITERRQAEQERERLFNEVQHRAAELDAIIDAIVNPTAAFDAHGVLIRPNPAMVMTMGRDPTGMTHAEIAHVLSMRRPDGTLLEESETPIIRALRGESVVGERLLITDCDNHVMIVLISAAPLIEKDRPWGVVSIWHDISKREHLREEAERRAAELVATLSSIADGVIVYSTTGEVLRPTRLPGVCLDIR